MRSARDVEGAQLPGPGATAPPAEQPIPTATTLTVSGRFQKPEIVLFAEPTQKHSRVLVLKVILNLLPMKRQWAHGPTLLLWRSHLHTTLSLFKNLSRMNFKLK